MFTFLSRAYRVEVEREYRKRLLAVSSGLLFVLSFLAAALALPPYFILSVKKSDAVLALKAAALPSAESVGFESQVKDIQAKAQALKGSLDERSLITVFERVALRTAQGGITISGMSVKRGGAQATVSLTGMASTREALVSFSKGLEGEPSFKGVALPVSALAKSRDIAFTITLDAKL